MTVFGGEGGRRRRREVGEGRREVGAEIGGGGSKEKNPK